jgi:hypothetical protein
MGVNHRAAFDAEKTLTIFDFGVCSQITNDIKNRLCTVNHMDYKIILTKKFCRFQ